MKEDISSMNCDIVAMKNEIGTLSQRVSNQREEIDGKLGFRMDQ